MRKHVLKFGDFVVEKYLGPGQAEDYADSYEVPYKKKISGTESEMTSASSVGKSGEISSFLIDVVGYLKKQLPEEGVTGDIKITGGNDAFHHTVQKDYVSRHESGNAIDFVLTNPTKKNIRKTNRVLRKLKRKYSAYDFRFIDEYSNPTAKATAGHFHLSIKNDPDLELKFDVSAPSDLANGTLAATGAYRANQQTVDIIDMAGKDYAEVIKYLADVTKKNDSLLNVADPNQVAAVQQGLLDVGQQLPKHGVDGRYGPETRAAVRNFQTDNNLRIDGIVGKETLGALSKKVKRNA